MRLIPAATSVQAAPLLAAFLNARLALLVLLSLLCCQFLKDTFLYFLQSGDLLHTSAL